MAYAIVSYMGGPNFPDDSILIQSCISRDLTAWALFTKKYSHLINISIKNRLAKYGFGTSGHDIEDIKQDVLVSIWNERKLESLKNHSSLQYWLSIVSGNAALEHMRRLRREPASSARSIYENIGGSELHELIPSRHDNANDVLSTKEFSEKLEAEINSLPVRDRLIIKLHILHSKGYADIADMLGLPMGTISSSVKRTKDKWKEIFKDFLQ